PHQGNRHPADPGHRRHDPRRPLTQRKAPAMSKHKNPRSFDRPPLTALSNIFMILTYLSAFATVAAAIVALFIADPVGMVVALSMFGSAIACGLAWTVVYIA